MKRFIRLIGAILDTVFLIPVWIVVTLWLMVYYAYISYRMDESIWTGISVVFEAQKKIFVLAYKMSFRNLKSSIVGVFA